MRKSHPRVVLRAVLKCQNHSTGCRAAILACANAKSDSRADVLANVEAKSEWLAFVFCALVGRGPFRATKSNAPPSHDEAKRNVKASPTKRCVAKKMTSFPSSKSVSTCGTLGAMSADTGSNKGRRFKFDAPFDIVPVLFRFEPPDIVVARPSRSPTPDEMAALGSFFVEARDHLGGTFVLSILSGDIKRVGSSASMDMNRQLSTGMVKATAIVGADFHMRTAAETQMRAARSLKLDFAKVLVEFFDDEASARVWFDKLRDASIDTHEADTGQARRARYGWI